MAGCSTAVVMMRLPCFLRLSQAPRSTVASLSVPQDVKNTSSGEAFRAPATWARAFFRIFSAFTPILCKDEGFPKSSVIVFAMICATSGRTWVVALLSKYTNMLLLLYFA